MVYTVEPNRFLYDFDQVIQARYDAADQLNQMVQRLSQLDPQSDNGSLGLSQELNDLKLATHNLQQGIFRLMILGDMKRGKSTFLNALLGEPILPSDVNPCTAVLTIVKYGPEKQVTIHFKDDRSEEQLDFKTFKQRYTLDPTRSESYQADNQLAFPDVDYAVVEYPLPLLEKGVEIIDSPGLNDTEALNQLSLYHLNQCHAVLFVLRADQPLTLNERRYLDVYIKGRGLSLFFLINAWDEVQKGLLDPENADKLLEAEERLRRLFRVNLADYCRVGGQDLFEQRVFELSSLAALRRRVKDPDDNLDGTGFPAFLQALDRLLSRDRALIELQQAKRLARQTYNRVHEIVERRIPLLGRELHDLKHRIEGLEPQFQKLAAIRDQLKHEIRVVRDRESRAVAESFRQYVLNLETTFEDDFFRYQPAIGLIEFIQQEKREEFISASKRAFERYLGEKMADWELTAEQRLTSAFQTLTDRVSDLGSAYGEITNQITDHLLGQQIYRSPNPNTMNRSNPGWAEWASSFFSLATGNFTGLLMATNGFSWKDIMANGMGVLGVAGFVILLAGSMGLIWVPILGLGIGALQMEYARRELSQSLKQIFVNHLPELADQQVQPIQQLVVEAFDRYEIEITDRINSDIWARREELDNLLKLKLSESGTQEAEIRRLNQLDDALMSSCRGLEAVYDRVIATLSTTRG